LLSASADVERMGFSTNRIAVWFLDRKSGSRFFPCYDPREEILA
jgi:hypothetical protein